MNLELKGWSFALFAAIVILASCFIHALAHIAVGYLFGYAPNAVGINSVGFYVEYDIIGAIDPIVGFLIKLAGGVVQGIFFLLVARVEPVFRSAAYFCFVYAVFEVFVL